MAIATEPKQDTGSMGALALEYARRGWAVIPLHTPDSAGACSCRNAKCASPGKHPRVMQGLKAAAHDPGQVAKWWAQWPEANIGIVCGAVSGLVVLDVDGPEGEESLKALEAAIGPLPETVEALTGKGRHLYFNHPGVEIRPSAGVLGRGLDVRGDGGYVVGPPSLHYTGRRYEWEVTRHLEDMDPADFPEAWIRKLQKQDKPKRAQRTAQAEKIPEGRRNETLTSKAGSMRRAGFSADEILAALLTMNEHRCDPPLDAQEVETVARSVARYDPAPQMTIRPQGGPEIRETDLGNARRLVRLHGKNLRYCYPWGKWLVWTGTHWEIDDTGTVGKWAKETVREIYNEAAAEPQDERRQALVKHALRSESLNKINAMVSLAESEPGIPVRPEDLDLDPWLLNCQNGTLNLKTMELYSHRREDLLTNVLAVPYDASAQCPKWEAFLGDIFAGNEALIEFVQQAVGYSLSGITDERCMFILYGKGRNGKSTFVEALADLLGPYAMKTEITTLTDKRQGNAATNDLARLRGARFVHVSETDEGRRFAEGKVKDLTGGDRISARFLYAEIFEYVPEFKIWMATNYKPQIRGTDPAIWDRIRLIPFTVRIPDNKLRPKRTVMAEFEAEQAGILAWAVAGCVKWLTQGLGMPEAVRTATEGYREEMDVLAGFIDDCCILSKEAFAKASDLYAAYRAWCEKSGEHPMSLRTFGTRLGDREFEKKRLTSGIHWYGLGLSEETLKLFEQPKTAN
jgi:putative DNA primase/helicase